MKEYKILCSGDPSDPGIAQEIAKIFPQTTFISRKLGYDLTTDDGQNYFKSILANHNVFINNTYADGVQEILLDICSKIWESGHVFNIGSVSENTRYLWADPEYGKIKQSLREKSLMLGNEKFKTTHMVVAGFQSISSGSKHTMNPKHIADVIAWILEQPFEIPIIGIEQMNDYIRDFFNKKIC